VVGCCTEPSEDLESWSYHSESFDRTVSPCLLFRGLRIINHFSQCFVAVSFHLRYVDVHAGLETGNPDQNAPVFGRAISDGSPAFSREFELFISTYSRWIPCSDRWKPGWHGRSLSCCAAPSYVFPNG
jgi:hypothetical protein